MSDRYRIEMYCGAGLHGGWADACWTDDDKPFEPATQEEAQAAIDEHIQDSIDAVDAGDLDEAYSPLDYRVVKIQSPTQ